MGAARRVYNSLTEFPLFYWSKGAESVRLRGRRSADAFCWFSLDCNDAAKGVPVCEDEMALTRMHGVNSAASGLVNPSATLLALVTEA